MFILLISLIGVVSAFDDANIPLKDLENDNLSITDDYKSFTQLNSTVNNESVRSVKLVDNYKYCENDSSFKNGINLNQSNLIVDGQGHIIDCNNQSSIFNIHADNVSLKNIIFKGTINWEGSHGLLDNCTFINCTAIERKSLDTFIIVNQGDIPYLNRIYSIYWSGSFGSVTNCNFINFTNFGAVQWVSDNGNIFNSTFINCSSHSSAIYMQSDNATFKDCIFKNCRYGSSVLEVSSTYNVSVINSSFINCTSYDYCLGAIYWRCHNGSIVNSSFINCSGKGAVSWYGHSGSISGSVFVNNNASNGGGAISWFGDNGHIIGSVFVNNSAKNNGGAVLWDCYYGNGSIQDCQFINNTAEGFGSAVCWDYGRGVIINSNFTNNVVKLYEPYVTSQNCIFTYTDEFLSFFNNLTPNSVINLTKDYVINADLQIDVDNITINGNGHKLTDFSKSKKFFINAANITFKDVEFENIFFYWVGDGGNILNCNFTDYVTSAVLWCGRYGRISDTNFNNASIRWEGYWGNILNCNFSNFSTTIYEGGGVISWLGNNGNIEKSNFINCSNSIYGSGSISSRYFGGVVIHCSGSNNRIVSCSFLNCGNPDYNGGAIYLRSSNGEIIDCNFTNCSCINGGAVYCYESNVNIINCNFINCSASYGGAICWEYVNGSVVNCTFINSTAVNGGAVYLIYGNVNIINSDFTDNTADLGNAIYSNYASGDINNTNFINNNIYEYSPYLKLNNCVFNVSDEFARLFNNLKPNSIINLTKDYIINFNVLINVENITVIGNGHILDGRSRIFTITSDKVTLKDILFKNSKSYEGGTLYWDGSEGNIFNCTFINSSSSRGGAILWKGIRGNIVNSTFINCSSKYLGDAIYWTGNYGRIINSQFINCFNESAIFCAGDWCSFINSTFINCTSSDDGGAISCCGSHVNIFNCNFTDCIAYGNNTVYGGGAVYCNSNSGNISQCNFINCYCNNNGGAIYCGREESSVSECSFINCSSKSSGGAISFDHQDSMVLNCRFINCTSLEYAGAIFFDIRYGKSSSVLNCNFTKCTSTNNSSAIYWMDENGSVIGCICDDILVMGKNSVYKYFNFNLNKSYEIKFGEDLILNPIDDENVKGYVQVYIDGVYNSLVFKTSDTFKLSNIDIGNHTIDLIYLGSDTYGRNKYTFNLTVTNASKISSKITALSVNTVYNQHKYLTITLKDDEDNVLKDKSVIICINNKKSLVNTDSKGQINIETKGYNPSTYKVEVNFQGDDKYTASSKTLYFNVKKQTPILNASKKTFKAKLKIKKFKTTLKDRNNRAIKNAKITLKIKSKIYTAKTNSNGVAIFKIKLTKKGNYKTIIKFAGSKLYSPISKSVIVSLKK